jgi:hypothetical protein
MALATHDDLFFQAKEPRRPNHQDIEKSGLHPKSPEVADSLIDAQF